MEVSGDLTLLRNLDQRPMAPLVAGLLAFTDASCTTALVVSWMTGWVVSMTLLVGTEGWCPLSLAAACCC